MIRMIYRTAFWALMCSFVVDNGGLEMNVQAMLGVEKPFAVLAVMVALEVMLG